jgi:hypothetical protein
MSDESDPSFLSQVSGLAREWVESKRRSLQASPRTDVDGYDSQSRSVGSGFGEQHIGFDELREIKEIRESGGQIATLMESKALLNFGESVEIHVENNEETAQVVDGDEKTLQEWLTDAFPHIELEVLALGEDALTYPYAVGEILETQAGGFKEFLPAEPFTLKPKTNRKGEIQAWEQVVNQSGSQKTQTLPPDAIKHFVLNRNSARDKTGISELLRNKDEIEAFRTNQQAIEQAIELHGFPQRHVKVGTEDGAPIRDNELRRVRQIFDPRNTDANTAYFTGSDVEVDTLEAHNFDYQAIHEMDMRNLTTALGLPLEAGNVGSDGLGSGKPAELRFALLKLQITANQRRFGMQFVEKVFRPVVDQYSPFDPDAHMRLELDDPLEDIGDMASVIQSVGDYMTPSEARERLDLPETDIEENEFGPPGDSGEQGGGLFGSAGGDTGNPNRELAEIPEKYTDGTGLSEDDFVPNQSILDVIEPTLDFIDTHGLPNPDNQQEGATRINQLKRRIDNNEPLEPGFWQEILNFHKRHRAQGNHECDESELPEQATEIDNSRFDECHYDAGWFSNRTWGGDTAYEQAQRIVDALESADVEINASANETDTDGLQHVSEQELAQSPEWEQPLLEMQQRIWETDTGDTRLLNIPRASETPEFVKERIKDAIRGGAIFSDIDGIPGSELMNLRENMLEELAESDGWTIDGVADKLEQFGMSTDQARTVARTETASVLNTARETGYEERGDEDNRFYWTGVFDDGRTTEACQWLMEQTHPQHGGSPVPMDELKELIDEAPEHDPEMQDNLARPENFVVHPNERKTFVRFVEGTFE